MGKYQDIKKEENSFYKKFKKCLKKAIVGGAIAAVAMIVAPYLLFDVSDMVFVLGWSGILAVTAGGIISSVTNGVKAHKSLKQYEKKQEEKDYLFNNQEEIINNLQNENHINQRKISNIKSDYKSLRNAITSSINKDDNNFKDEEIEHHKTL